MNIECPKCGASLRWRILRAEHVSLSQTLYACPACAAALRQNPWPAAYNLVPFWIMLPTVPLVRILLAEQSVGGLWWLVVGFLGVAAFAGWRWSMRAVSGAYRRYEEA